MSGSDASSAISADGKILREARKQFKRCAEWESVARPRFIEDEKFCYGDSDNKYQWDSTLYSSRDQSGKPSLTINKTKQHCLQIINDARQNKAGIEVRPVGDGASKEAADVFEGVIRYIEYISNAQAAYDTATWNQVVGGIGWLRIVTEYANDDSFDQEIFIRRVPNALSIYLDPDIQEYDGSDARFGFVFRDMPREEFDASYPKLKDRVGAEVLDMGEYGDAWDTEDHVRVAEYYRVIDDDDNIIALLDGTTMRESEASVGDLRTMAMAMMGSDDPEDAIRRGPDGKPMRRPVKRSRIEWFLLAGDQIADRSEWLGAYIPLIRVVGEETVINGQMDRRGHTRALKDPQRMYNFWSSAAVEQVALQTKTPWLASMEAVGPYEEYYKNANVENFAWLPWVERSETGQPTTKPERILPPVMADAYLKGMQVSANEMMMVSGQYQAVMGAQSNETSGKAINARQRQGDNATYHFIDHLALAIRLVGKQLIDLIPKIYDTKRVMRVIAENGDESEVTIDPQAQQAHQAAPGNPDGTQKADVNPQQGDPNAQATPDVRIIFNPNVGRYDVVADVGPAYATRRQEAFNAFTQIMQGNPDLMSKIGDLMFKAADFPMAEDIAERFDEIRKGELVPKQAVDQIQQQLQALSQHAQQEGQKSTETIGRLVQQIAANDLDNKRSLATQAMRELRHEAALTGAAGAGDGGQAEAVEAAQRAHAEQQRTDIDVYRAETDRMKAIGTIDPEAFRPVLREMISQMLGEHIGPIMDAHAKADRARLPVAEATEADE